MPRQQCAAVPKEVCRVELRQQCDTVPAQKCLKVNWGWIIQSLLLIGGYPDTTYF